jgi:hypothetical protein
MLPERSGPPELLPTVHGVCRTWGRCLVRGYVDAVRRGVSQDRASFGWRYKCVAQNFGHGIDVAIWTL